MTLVTCYDDRLLESLKIYLLLTIWRGEFWSDHDDDGDDDDDGGDDGDDDDDDDDGETETS